MKHVKQNKCDQTWFLVAQWEEGLGFWSWQKDERRMDGLQRENRAGEEESTDKRDRDIGRDIYAVSLSFVFLHYEEKLAKAKMSQ